MYVPPKIWSRQLTSSETAKFKGSGKYRTSRDSPLTTLPQKRVALSLPTTLTLAGALDPSQRAPCPLQVNGMSFCSDPQYI